MLTLLVAFVVYLGHRPDLSVWHTAKLDEEFTADSEIGSFEEYLKLEDRLFAQLSRRVYDNIEPGEETNINRYHRGSLTDPSGRPTNCSAACGNCPAGRSTMPKRTPQRSNGT